MRRSKKFVDKLSDDENETNTIQINSSNGRLDPKWRGLFLRSVFGLLLIVTFGLIIKVGPIGLVFMVLVIYFRGFQELCNVGYEAFNLRTVPYYKQTSFTLFFIFNYFVLGHKIIEKFGHVLNKYSFTMLLAQHHKFISFNLYTIYFLIFVLMLQKPYYRKQYTLYAYTHMIILVYASCYMTIGNILEGSIWFIYPVLLVVFNDIAAYVFGFFLGKTKLIDVSPNKTWEGFVGAFFTTLLFGQVICPLMCPYDFFTCPVEFLSDKTGSQCTNLLFRMDQVEFFGSSFGIYPFQKHALVLSLYASLVSPFGGFFASGFKRAIGIKDFGNTIPGHGGIIDRFDCHIITNIFVNLYINSII